MSQPYTHYHDILLPSILGRHGEIYLRSTNQKRLFAKKRSANLKKAVHRYNQIQTTRIGGILVRQRKTTSFSMEIEFDHFVMSLRSSIEHLMQLINFIVGLGLSPTSNNRASRVDAENVITSLKSNGNPLLKRLGNYLQKEKRKDWYKMLHKLRIEMYHNKFDKFATEGREIKFKLPNNTVVDLLTYCSTATRNVERVISYSLKSLTEFKNLS